MGWFNRKFGKEKNEAIVKKAIEDSYKVETIRIVIISSKTYEIINKTKVTIPMNTTAKERQEIIDKEFEDLLLTKVT